MLKFRQKVYLALQLYYVCFSWGIKNSFELWTNYFQVSTVLSTSHCVNIICVDKKGVLLRVLFLSVHVCFLQNVLSLCWIFDKKCKKKMRQRKVEKICVEFDCILKIFCLLILIIITAKNVVQGPINTWMRNSTKIRENEILIQGGFIIFFFGWNKKKLRILDFRFAATNYLARIVNL